MVTGGSGFIGKKLLKDLDNSFTFDFDGEDSESCDIRSLKKVNEKLNNVKGVIHLAAVSRVKDCENDPYSCLEINVLGTLNVLNGAVKNNVEWFLMISTGEVKWVQNDSIKSFYKPDNLYGVSKVSGELMLDFYATKFDLKCAVLRISSVVFGGIDDNQDKVFPIFLKRAVCGEKIVINDSSSKWDFIHVSDLVNEISKSVNVLKNKENIDNVLEIEVSSGDKLDLLSLAKVIHYLSNSLSSIEFDGETLFKVEKSEYISIIGKNKLSNNFISSLKREIIEYKNYYCPSI